MPKQERGTQGDARPVGTRRGDGQRARCNAGARRGVHPVLAVACALVVVALVVAIGVTSLHAGARDQAAERVRASVLEAALQCCAVEGAYPSSLDHLVEHYGLVIDTKHFVVTYEAFASNVAPSVQVVPR